MQRISLLGVSAISMFALPAFTHTLPDDWQLVNWANRSLQACFATETTAKIKAYILMVTPDYFFRLKRSYQGGKQEYYSFHLHRFKDMDYAGTASAGILRLETDTDDIIVQTFNDPHGDVDSMATNLDLPVHNIRAEQLDSLRNVLLELKERH